MQIKINFLYVLLFLSSSIVRGTPLVNVAQANSISLQSGGGKFLAAGSVTINGIQQYMIARYTSFGTVDISFGNYGYVSTPMGATSFAQGLAIVSEDMPIAVGLGCLTAQNEFALARYNSNGSLDTTFNATGVVNQSIGAGACAYNIVVDTSGRYVIAGVSIINDAPIITVVRYNSNGSIDSSFGNNGVAIKRIFGSAAAYDVGLQSFGAIVTAGFAVDSGARVFALARFTTDGVLDTTLAVLERASLV